VTRPVLTVALATQITKSQRTYEKLAKDCWDGFDVTSAIRYRGVADGLEQALHMLAAVCQEYRTEPAAGGAQP